MTAIQRARFIVAASGNGWVVERAGFDVDSTHRTKEAAVKRAVQLARSRQPSELEIHRQDGSIHEVRTYGSDPRRILNL